MPSSRFFLGLVAVVLGALLLLSVFSGEDPSAGDDGDGNGILTIGGVTWGDTSWFPWKSASEKVEEEVTNVTEGRPLSSLSIWLHSGAATAPEGEVVVFACREKPTSASGISGYYYSYLESEVDKYICDRPGIADPILVLPVDHGKAFIDFSSLPASTSTVNASNSSNSTTLQQQRLRADTQYDFYFHGTADFYDSEIGRVVFEDDGTAKSLTPERNYDVEAVGQLFDPVNEAKPQNGQTSTDLRDAGTRLGCIEGACENDDTLFYDLSGDGKETPFYVDLSITCGGYGSTCRNVAVWFDFGFPRPEGNEFSAITAELEKGHDRHLSTDWLPIFKQQNPEDDEAGIGELIYVGDLKSGEISVYRVEFAPYWFGIDENDPFCIAIDDLHHQRDFFGGTKAEPVRVCFGFVE